MPGHGAPTVPAPRTQSDRFFHGLLHMIVPPPRIIFCVRTPLQEDAPSKSHTRSTLFKCHQYEPHNCQLLLDTQLAHHEAHSPHHQMLRQTISCQHRAHSTDHQALALYFTISRVLWGLKPSTESISQR